MPRMTEQQLRDYTARMRGVTNPVSEGMRAANPQYGYDQIGNCAPCQDESDLHDAIIDYCRERGWQYLHGSMAARTHRTLGEPDFVILAEHSKIRFVECKSKTGKLSPDQQAFIAHARKNGHIIYVVRTMEEFKTLFI